MESRNSPLVTVAIPVFRGEQYIQSAMDSVLAQSLSDFELLVVDNASDDRTAEIVLSYSDPRIFFVRNEENIGAEGNWNKCLALAKGQYVKILPHDDTIDPDCLKEQVAVFKADLEQRIKIVFCARRIINQAGKSVAERRIRSLDQGVIAARDLIRLCVRRGTNLIGEPGAVLFRSRDALTVGAFDGRLPYVIDLDYWVRLLALGDAYYIGKTLSTFRVSSGSWSVEIGTSQSKEFAQFIDLVAGNPSSCIRNVDRYLGRIAATLNGVARRIFYWLLVR
jgi:glycosyltransferase involved in cell wall biosynthesis